MLDARFVRENVQLVQAALEKRGYAITLDEFITLEGKRREIIGEVEELRNRRNRVSDEIGRLKKRGEDGAALISEMKDVSKRIKDLDEELRDIDGRIRDFLLNIPNIPHESVPAGRDENDNVEIRRWGDPGEFDFEPLNHWDIAETLGIIDFERASKIAGSRFSLMKGPGAKLERALMNFMLDLNTSKGYKEV